MSKFLSLISLRDHFVFNGTINELNEKIRLNNNKKFRVEWSDYNKFKFIANWSLGTFMMRGFPGAVEGIKGFADLTKIGENKTKVELSTKVRGELYFFLIILTILCITGFTAQADFPLWVLLLIPAGLLWFWFVYRVQEKIFDRKIKVFNNRELSYITSPSIKLKYNSTHIKK